MKVMLSCNTCMMELIESGVQIGSKEFEEHHWAEHVDVGEHGVYEATCPQGHRIVCGVSNRRFELLFDAAALALVDGYYREAIATFASALERFFEFYIRVVLRNCGVGGKEIDGAWKLLGNRSERQLGAFCVTYLLHNKRPFEMLTRRMEELRNDVVHKGLFATRAQALEYGEYVYNVIYALIDELQREASESVRQEADDSYLREVRAGIGKIGYEGSVSGIGYSTLIGSHRTDRIGFREAFAKFGERNPWSLGVDAISLGKLADKFGMTAREFLRELASGKYAAAFGHPQVGDGAGEEQ
ncbi:hypothetical protein [Sorangium sp. So ce693]|uniref:hypothetical protein n=1 Tax=Sorangium sp. So ce693 TaxID=3133318 RepID=UPI003F61F735